MRNIKNLKMISEIKAKIDEHDVISFDIFDTLLLRAYVDPGDLFKHLEALNEENDFAGKRRHADGAARARNPEREEVTFDQIYDVLGTRLQYLKQQELDMEESALTANPEMLEVFNYAKSLGKKIIICSDMYFSSDFLDQVLQKKGYTDYFKLYVSSDLNKTKRSGNLYKYVIKELAIAPDKILHIGDNLQADCQVAESVGITPFYYEKIIHRFLQQNPRATIFYQKNHAQIGASIILAVSAIKSLTVGDDYWQNLGYDYAGPLAYGYAEWLYRNFKKDGIKDALFIARDGYNLKRIFDLFKDNDIKSHYFYAPRCFYQAIKLRADASVLIESDKLDIAKAILGYYKNKHPYLQANTPEISTLAEGVSFIQANYQLYVELALVEIAEYSKYIASENIQSDNIALVDIQSFMLSSQKLLTSFMPDKTIQAYYWRYLKTTSYDNPEFHCKAFEPNIYVKRNWAFMEFILTAPELPIIGIKNEKPVYQENISDLEKMRIEKYFPISDGTFEFATDLQKYFHGEYTFIDDNLIVDLTSILEEYPYAEDLKNIFEIQYDTAPDYATSSSIFKSWSSFKEELSKK